MLDAATHVVRQRVAQAIGTPPLAHPYQVRDAVF
jgi:hypothetical protein